MPSGRSALSAGLLGLLLLAIITSGNSSQARTQFAAPQSSTVWTPHAAKDAGGDRGPSRRVDRMPAGFAHSAEGARAAGEAFAADAEQTMLYLSDDDEERAQRQISSARSIPDGIHHRQSATSEWRPILGAGRGQLWWIVTPLASKVIEYDGSKATVNVWVEYVMSRDGATRPRSWYGMSHLELVWERGDWKIDDQRISDGPVPAVAATQSPWSATGLNTALDGFELPGRQR